MSIVSIPSSGLWGAIAALLNGNFNDLKERMGWADYNDVATIAAPIALTLANTDYQLTNDGLGTHTNTAFQIDGHGDIWDVATDQFDFSSLKVGDVVTIRGDMVIHASGPTRDFFLSMIIGVGHASELKLDIGHHTFKTAGDYHVLGTYTFYIGADFVKNNPAKLMLQSDNTGDSVTVHGWFIKTEVR